MRVLLLGGAGYLGVELLYALAGKNSVEVITVLDNFRRAHHNVFLGVRKLKLVGRNFVLWRVIY